MTAEINDDRTLAEVRSLIENLQGLLGLEEGQLYTLSRGLLHHVRTHEDDDALRRVRVMEEAYGGDNPQGNPARRASGKCAHLFCEPTCIVFLGGCAYQ